MDTNPPTTNPNTENEPDQTPRSNNGDYARPNMEPTTEAEKMERKNPLGYTMTEATEEADGPPSAPDPVP